MGKALKTVGMVVGAAALIATGAGAILMPGMAGTTTLFGVSVGTLNTVSAGLVAVGGMLDKPQSAGSGSADEWTSNPDQPTPFAFGRVGCSGKIVHRDEYGPDNRLQGIVSVYSGAGPIKAFLSYKVDDVAVTFASNGGTANGKYNRQMWRSWRLGAQPDTALSLPTGLDGGAVMPAWGAAYKLSGKACELLTVQQDSKFSVYPTGLPTPQATIEGIYGYDPRYDSTHPGGFGDCRLGVRSTYRWINNPIIAGLNWALGMVENGKVVGGIGASPQGIDIPAFVEAANVSDANGWTVTAWPDTSEDVSEVLKQFLQAGGASYARHAGKISCVSRGAAKPSIVTVTGRDTCGPIELDTGSSLFNRINTITPSFMSEAHGWKHVPADPVTFESLRTEDGGKRGDQITYRFVGNAQQAAQLAAYDILDAREPFSGTVPFKPHLRRLKRGDCFVLSEPGFLLDGVKCMVLGRTYNAQTGEVRVSFRSETDGKHALALGKTSVMPEYPALTPADPTLVSAPLPEDWIITPRPPVVGGGQVPGFDLVGEVSNGTATAVLVEYGPSATGPWKQAYQGPPTVTNVPIDGVQPGAVYYIAVRYLREQNYSERYVYGPYTAPLLDPSPTAPTIVAIKNDIAAAFGDIFDVSALVADARSDLDAVDAEVVAARGGSANLAARVAAVNQARIDGDTANASAISGVAARTAQTEADIIDLENAQASESLARAQAISQLTAKTTANPNLIPNGNFERGNGQLWDGGSALTYAVNPDLGGAMMYAAGTSYRIYPRSPAANVWSGYAATMSAQAVYQITSSDWAQACVIHYADDAETVQAGQTPWRNIIADGTRRQFLEPNYVKPANARKSRVVFSIGPSSRIVLNGGAKIETGSACTVYTADTSTREMSASLTQQSLAIIDLENQQNIASWYVKADASGGKPAVLGVFSSIYGSGIALGAEQVFLGDNTTIDTVTQTQQGVWGSTRRVIANGPPFGPDNLIHWAGPSNIALSAMTKANAGFWQDQNGMYGPTPVPLFWAKATPSVVTKTRSGAGSIATNVNDVIVTCLGGTSGATCTWSRVSGDASISFPSSGFTPTFSTTLTVGQIKTAVFAGLVIKGGETALVYLTVEFQETT